MSTMRGLKNFIADVRATIAPEDELKIVNEEKAKIRQCFASPKADSYDRRKYCLKLMYMHILGHNIDFGLLQASQLMTSKVRDEKIVGYIVLGELLHDNKDFLRLVTQTIMYDLQQVNEFATPLALTFVANVANAEMAEVVAPACMQLVAAQKTQVNSYIRKKAALALLHCYRINPASVDTENINSMLITLMEAKNVGFLSCLTHLLYGISDTNSKVFEVIKTRAIYLLSKIIIKKEVSVDHQYHGCPCPWLIISLMRFLRRLAPRLEEAQDKDHGLVNQRTMLESVINEIFKMCSGISSSAPVDKQQIFWALAYETGVLSNYYAEYFEETIKVDFMIKTVTAKDTKPNVRFAAISTLAEMSRMVNVSIAIRANIRSIVEIVSYEMDFSLRGKGQVLLFNSADVETAEGIVLCLLGGAKATRFPKDYREDSLLRAAILCERYGLYSTIEADGVDTVKESLWTLRAMINLLPTASELHLRFIWANLANAIMLKIVGADEYPDLKAQVLFQVISACFNQEQIQQGNLLVVDDPLILTTACYIITESVFESFGKGYEGIFYGIESTRLYAEYGPLFSAEAIFQIVSQAIIMLSNGSFKEEQPVAVSAMIALCYMSLCPMENLQMLIESPVADVQQRAAEAMAIMQIPDRELVATLLQQTPLLKNIRGLEAMIKKGGSDKPYRDEDIPESDENDATSATYVEEASESIQPIQSQPSTMQPVQYAPPAQQIPQQVMQQQTLASMIPGGVPAAVPAPVTMPMPAAAPAPVMQTMPAPQPAAAPGLNDLLSL